VTVYSRYVNCTKGHRTEVFFSWSPDSLEGPKEYSEPCLVSGCDGLVAGKLPVGAEFKALQLPRPQ
jgi:hypothetical protein